MVLLEVELNVKARSITSKVAQFRCIIADFILLFGSAFFFFLCLKKPRVLNLAIKKKLFVDFLIFFLEPHLNFNMNGKVERKFRRLV